MADDQPDTYILANVWEIQVAHISDQGGCVGMYRQICKTKEAAHEWFDKFQDSYPNEDFLIHDEGPRKAMINTKKNKAYLVAGKRVTLYATQ